MLKFKSLTLKKKGKKHSIQVVYTKQEVNKQQDIWDAEYSKKTNQYLSQELDWEITGLTPHLLWTNELISSDLSLDKSLDYKKYFADHSFAEDERFDNIHITKILFFGSEQLDSVKLFGYKETSLVSRGFKSPLQTPQITLDREKQDYALLTILDEQINNLLIELERYLEEGHTLSKNQQMALFEQVEAEQD